MKNANERAGLSAFAVECSLRPNSMGDKLLFKRIAEMLEADALELTRLRELARDAANAATQLQKQVLLLRAQRVVAPEGNWLWCKLMDFCKKRGFAPTDFNDLFVIVGEARAKQSEAPTWEAERLDEYEIRVTSPEGESWRLRSADRNDSFNNFIWRWAESMVNKGAV